MDAFYKRFTNLTINVKCTLEELYYGCYKTVHYERLRLQGDSERQVMEVANKTIQIRPGMGAHTQMRFPGEGHLRPGQLPTDLVIQIQEVPHESFTRAGNDLVLQHKITLHDALTAKPVSFKTLEGETIDASFDEVVSPQTMKVVPGKGMPLE